MRPSYRFRPRVVPSLITLVLLPVLAGLGVWQLQRADAKRALRERVSAQATQSPRVLSAPLPDPESLYLTRVAARGAFDRQRQYLLANQVRDGRSGYLVLTPLRLEGSETAVLVARDWVVASGERSNRPSLPATPSGRQEITGVATDGPSVGFKPGDAYAGDGDWPRQVIYIDFDAMDDSLPYDLAPVVIRGDVAPAELSNQFTGRMTPQRHIGYAFQWFALALTLVVIYIVANLRREEANEQ